MYQMIVAGSVKIPTFKNTLRICCISQCISVLTVFREERVQHKRRQTDDGCTKILQNTTSYSKITWKSYFGSVSRSLWSQHYEWATLKAKIHGFALEIRTFSANWLIYDLWNIYTLSCETYTWLKVKPHTLWVPWRKTANNGKEKKIQLLR